MMAHPEDVVAESVNEAKGLLRGWLRTIPPEELLRVDAIQTQVDTWLGWIERAAFDAIFETLTELGERRARSCPRCGRNRERDGRTVRVRTKRLVVETPMHRYRCRACGTSSLPVRDWLGVESGQTTAGFDRAVVTLASELSFGATATQMMEQHGHVVNRTLIERRTYAIGKDAAVFLKERGQKLLSDYMERRPGTEGAERVELQVDSGGVRVGVLTRPPLEEAKERTPERGLAKGQRTSSRREVRAIMAKCPGDVDGKVVNLHIAPRNDTDHTGEKMFLAALEAGLGDNTHVHGTFDMAPWQAEQFKTQFEMQEKWTICADYFHTMEYVAAAAPAFVEGDDRLLEWRRTMARELMAGERPTILEALRKHRCSGARCPSTDKGECAVKAAMRYLTNNGKYMDYPTFVVEGLPIGSGEIEGLIRHAVRRRLDIPGDWREDNLKLMTAILTIRHSGWWDEFWRWRDNRDRMRMRQRIKGNVPNRFRGPARPRPLTAGHETLDLDELSPMFEAISG